MFITYLYVSFDVLFPTYIFRFPTLAQCAQSGFEDGLHKAIDLLNKELTSGRSIFTTKNKNKSKPQNENAKPSIKQEAQYEEWKQKDEQVRL